MPTLTRPGVYVDESAFPTYVSTTPGTAVACFVGLCPRGPLTPTSVSSWKEFTQWYGGFETSYPPSSLHLAVYSYFSAGGSAAIIIRVTTGASTPEPGSVILDDQGSSAQPTLQIVAANPGSWSNNVFVDILPGTLTAIGSAQPSAPLSFTLQVKYQGTAPQNVVEVWQNVSMTAGSTNFGINNYAPDVINSPYTGSKYIQLVDQFSTNSDPSNNPAPVNAAPLTGGLDGNSPNSPPAVPPAPQPTDWQNAVQLLDAYPDQPFVLNMCGQDDPTITGPVVSYAEQRGDVFVVLDPPAGMPPDAMTAWAQALTFRSAQAAVYYPQVLIADPYSSTVGRTRTIPPGGFVAGQYIATDASRSVAKAPAGLGTSLLGVYGLETVLTNDQQGTLNQANVNCLISVPGSGVVIWGARTLSAYLVTRYVSVSRSLIYLSTQFVAMTKFAVFEPNDWVLWNSITSVLSQFLNAFWQSGGLSGQASGQAYYVTCDQTNNTPDTIQQGIVTIEVGVALQFPAEFVVIKIGQWAGGQSVSVTST